VASVRVEAPPRIVVNGRFLAQPLTGVQRYGLETLRALDRLLSRRPHCLRGARWQLALPRDADEPPALQHFELHRLPVLRGHAWEQLTLREFSRGAFLVNTSYSGPLGKRDQCITVHDAAVRAHPRTYSLPYRWLHHALMTALAPRVDTLMTVSHFASRDIRHRHSLRRNDLLVGRPGADHLLATAVAPGSADDGLQLLKRHGLEPGRYLLAVGSLKPSKNFALVPRALAHVEPALRLPLAVAGAGDARLFRSDGGGSASLDDDAIRWLGRVSDEELRLLYRHAAWFVFPSLYEGFGLPALEAMALGCPVLAARSSSIPEVCGDAALYFEPHDALSLAAVLSHALSERDGPALRAQSIERAAARLSHYRWDTNAEILMQRLIAIQAVRAAPAHVGDAAAAAS
jgi:glycosyltransferase involved in cell wall biosynthesis